MDTILGACKWTASHLVLISTRLASHYIRTLYGRRRSSKLSLNTRSHWITVSRSDYGQTGSPFQFCVVLRCYSSRTAWQRIACLLGRLHYHDSSLLATWFHQNKFQYTRKEHFTLQSSSNDHRQRCAIRTTEYWPINDPCVHGRNLLNQVWNASNQSTIERHLLWRIDEVAHIEDLYVKTATLSPSSVLTFAMTLDFSCRQYPIRLCHTVNFHPLMLGHVHHLFRTSVWSTVFSWTCSRSRSTSVLRWR